MSDTSSNSGSYGISADKFETTLSESKFSESEADIFRFWFYYGKEREWPLSKLQDACGVSTTTLSRVFRNSYGADVASIARTLTKAKMQLAEASANPHFIESSLSRQIFAICDKTRALGNVSIGWGVMGIGKTTCLEEYQRQNNHGKTILARFPAGVSFAGFVTYLAKCCGVSTRSQGQYQQRQKIIQVLSGGKRLLIIDELHQAFLTVRGDIAIKCCEFLREIADQARCGLFLVGTELLEESFMRGPHKAALAQLVDRGTVKAAFPSKATKKDITTFLKHYGLALPDDQREPDAFNILTDIIKSSGLRKLTMHLRDGAAYANKRQETYTWTHFVESFDAIQSLSKKS